MHCPTVSGSANGVCSRDSSLARAEGFHYGDADAALFTEPVEVGADRIHAGHGAGGIADHGFEVGLRRHHIEGRVHTEHQQIDHAALDDPPRGDRIVGTGADRPDRAFALELLRVLEEVGFKDAAEILGGVDEKEHPEVDVVGVQAAQQVFKIFPAGREVAADVVLPVQVDRADVALNHHPVPPSGQRAADVGTHLLAGHEEVHQVDAVVERRMDGLLHRRVGLVVEVLTAEPDDAGGKAGSADFAVFHGLVSFSSSGGYGRRARQARGR